MDDFTAFNLVMGKIFSHTIISPYSNGMTLVFDDGSQVEVYMYMDDAGDVWLRSRNIPEEEMPNE